MGEISPWPTTVAPQVDQLQEELRAEQDLNLVLTESIADLELALEDRGWARIGEQGREFTSDGRRAIAAICRSLAISHPLIKRALTVRIGYIWGQGVQVSARAGDDDGEQDVNAVVQAFWDDNTKSLTSSQAEEELERALGTDGQVYLAAFTSPLTGRVQVRSTPADEIVNIITNPDDRDDPWFYVRQYAETVVEAGYGQGSTRTRSQIVTKVHPALGYRPTNRPRTLDGAEVRWDAPILHIPVNRLDGWKYGIPDVYAAAAWARMYRDFLVDWAGLTKSLSKIAFKATGDTKSRAAKAATAAQTAAALPARVTEGAGGTAVMGPGNTFEAVSKSGATIDANSGKPLAGMIAAGVGLPVTMLLADPGITGARATAETLDLPTVLEMGMRRLLWQGKLTELLNYVIDQAVLAPRGPLKGSLSRDDWGRMVVTLAGDTERTLDWKWPPLIDIDPVELVKAIVAADGTGKIPPLQTIRLILSALGVEDIDEILDEVTDDQGRWIDPEVTAGQVAADQHRAGQDPAPVVR